jgi:hypothetical protein
VRPVGDKEKLKEDLRHQIAPVEAVVALSSLYAQDKDLAVFQLLYAQANNKPVVLLKPFGGRIEVPKPLTRWDTIEFKMD